MRNDGQILVHPGGGGGRTNGFFPSSIRALSGYLKVVSSGASTVASTVRSAASSVVDRDPDANNDQVLYAGFDNLEWESGLIRKVLLVGYQSGFLVWDVEEAANVRNLAYRHDGPISLMQVLPKPVASKIYVDKFAYFRPLLAVSRDEALPEDVHALTKPCKARTQNFQDAASSGSMSTVVRFYSLTSQSYVHELKFKSAVYSVKCSTKVVAIAQAAQIHCFNTATLEREYTVLVNPVDTGYSGLSGVGYVPIAVGSRWLAYSGSAVAVPNSAMITPPEELSPEENSHSSLAKGSLVAQYAKESSKKFNDAINNQLLDTENVGMVVIRDVVSKSVIAQFVAHKSTVSSLCFDPSGTLLVTASVKGHNINVFKILGSSRASDPNSSYTHLFRLQRGFTNAVIQDISFSDDSNWIMVSSSRGTSHLFAINPSGETVNVKSLNACSTAVSGGLGVMTRPSVRWPSNAGSQALNELSLCESGPPVTLSVVSRIRSGSNNWRSALNGVAAAASGIMNSMPGAIASAFHNCGGYNLHGDPHSLKAKYHLLVFSPSGYLTQYAMRPFHRQESAGVRSHDPALDGDAGIVVEAIQKWNIFQKHNRGESDDIVDVYGDSGNSDISTSYKTFPDGTKKRNSRCPEMRSSGRKTKVCPEEGYNLFFTEAELQMHQASSPLWAKPKPKIYFQTMAMHDMKVGGTGEIEIELIPCQMVEARSKDSSPVLENPETRRYQKQSRTHVVDGSTNGQRLHSLAGASGNSGIGGAAVSKFHSGAEDIGGWEAALLFPPETKTYVNNNDNTAQFPDYVNNRECSLMAHMKFVSNSTRGQEMEKGAVR